jgi:hypothetical protein
MTDEVNKIDSNLTPEEPASEPAEPELNRPNPDPEAGKQLSKLVIEVAVLFTLISIGIFALVYMKQNLTPVDVDMGTPEFATEVDEDAMPFPDGTPSDGEAALMTDEDLIDEEITTLDGMGIEGIEDDYEDTVLDDLEE